jgi:MerR family transcriptional regulator/heat shock protein HspR
MHAQTLRYYERMGLIVPSRTRGNVRLYSEEDVQRLRQIKRLMDDLGVNLAGAEVILRMRDRIEDLERQLAFRDQEILRLRAARA